LPSGKAERAAVEAASATAVGYHMPPVPLLGWVLARATRKGDSWRKSPPMHRPSRRTSVNLELIRLALDEGSDLPRSAAAVLGGLGECFPGCG
jgi:hypothetical protein